MSSTSDTVFPEPRSPRYYSLDIWRGIACLMVVFYHSAFYEGFQNDSYKADDLLSWLVSKIIGNMWAGVTIFFVISGYCIMATTDISRRKKNAVKEYFLRRFKRIYPPYWAFIFLSFILVLFLYKPFPYLLTDTSHTIPLPTTFSVSQVVGNLTLTESWRFHFYGEQTKFFMDHIWTLCYEEQFYAICGLMLLFAPKEVFRISVCLSILVFFTRFFSSTLNIPVYGFFFDGRWLSFALGMLVYYLVNYASDSKIKVVKISLILSLLSIGWLELIVKFPYSKWRIEILLSIMFSLIILQLHHLDSQLYSSKWLKPVKFCGIICYSLYLAHVPIVKIISHTLYLNGFRGSWITILVTVPLSTLSAVGVSWFFYLMIEKRFLNKPQV